MKNEIRNITLAGFLTSLLYSVLVDDWSDPAPIINAILIGTSGGFLAGVLEVYVFAVGKQRLSFLALVVIRTLVYFIMLTILIILIKARIDSWFQHRGFLEHIFSNEFREFLFIGEFKNILAYSLCIIAIIIFFRQLSRYLGGNLLMDLMQGRYHQPKSEQRVFLLIDLKGSTTIAENMDQVDYYNFLNQFFRDISMASRAYRPSVYRYVGDQLTFSWLIKTGNEYSRCVDAFFAIKSFIKRRETFYQSQYGVQPVFRGTAHSGEVITGEVGDIRTQIIHMGTTLLEAAWMEKTGDKDLDKLCASETFIENIGSFRYKWHELATISRPQKGPMLIFEISGKQNRARKGISNLA